MSTTASSTSPSTVPRHTFSLFLLILTNLLWATSYVAGKFILQDISATMLILHEQITLITLLGGVLILISVFLLSHQ